MIINDAINTWDDIKKSIIKLAFGSEADDPLFVYCATTDKVFLCNIDDDDLDKTSYDKLLEMRIFNKKGEYRILRPNIGEAFRERMVVDDDLKPMDYFDQDMYMDIRKIEGNKAVSINGGSYSIPKEVQIKPGTMIRIRNYIAYNVPNDEEELENDTEELKDNRYDGQVRVVDWRLVGFVLDKK